MTSMGAVVRSEVDGSRYVLSPQAFLGVILGTVFGLLLLMAFIVVMGVLLYRARRTHRQQLADIEDFGMRTTGMAESRLSVPRPTRKLRRSTLLPYNTSAGWGALHSTDEVHRDLPGARRPPQLLSRISQTFRASFREDSKDENRTSWPLPSRLSRNLSESLQWLHASPLSAIMESPTSQAKTRKPTTGDGVKRPITVHMPTMPAMEPAVRVPKQFGASEPHGRSVATDEAAKGAEHGEPKSGEVKQPASSRPKASRSKSMVERMRPLSGGSLTEGTSRLPRPQMRVRSISLSDTQGGNAPTGPVPPLPVGQLANRSHRQRHSIDVSPSRASVSTRASIGSSIFGNDSSPIQRSFRDGTSGGVIQVCDGATREWKKSLTLGPRELRALQHQNGHTQTKASISSINSEVVRYSLGSDASGQPSRPNSASSTRARARKASPLRYRAVHRISGGRSSSPTTRNSLQRLHASPRRRSGIQVSSSGSPSQRQRSSVLQDVSGNQALPTRNPSQASTGASSTHSSNGNPFQWDVSQPLPKPSALKGSPTAKGHKRQNCVRISNLAPIVFGASRSSSLSSMHRIVEESPESIRRFSNGLAYAPTSTKIRPPSTSSFAPDVKLNPTTLRASLTPSSPTLSFVNFYQEDPSIAHLEIASPKTSPSRRNSKRLSDASSAFSIPKFPSPGRYVASGYTGSTPVLALQRPSSEFDLERPTPVELPSEPTSLTSPTNSLDPRDACQKSTFEIQDQTGSTVPRAGSAYLGASSIFVSSQLASSPPLTPVELPSTQPYEEEHPFRIIDLDGLAIDPALLTPKPEDSPPCSPTTSRPPAFLQDHVPHPFRDPPVTLAPHGLFADIAFTNPFKGDTSPALVPCSPRPAFAQLPAPAPMIQPSLTPSCFGPSTFAGQIPVTRSHNRASKSLNGPRVEPPKDLRKSVMQLRRMNSDADSDYQGGKRYLRMGREASPQLPSQRDSWGSLVELPVRKGDIWENEARPSDKRHGTEKPQEQQHEKEVKQQKSRNVWDDGERFWTDDEHDKENKTFSSGSRKEGAMTDSHTSIQWPSYSPPKKLVHKRVERLMGSALGTPSVKITVPSPPGIAGSPGSLYDKDGFLKD